MQTIPFALSIHHFISSVGADVGFASLIGLAILVLLYFAQARETATLRHRADEAADRVQQLESQLVVLSQELAALPAEISIRPGSGRAAGIGIPAHPPPGHQRAQTQAPAHANAEAGVGAPARPPAAPAGVAAPALAAATRLIPDPVAATAAPDLAQSGGRGGAAGDGIAVAPPGPATVAGGANGVARQPVAASAAAAQRPVGAPPVGAGPGTAGRPPGHTGAPAQGRMPAGAPRPAGAGARILPPLDRPASGRSRLVRVLAILVGCLVVAGVVVGLLAVTGGGSSAASKSAARNASVTHRPTRPVAFVPSSVSVTVLNGTDISGLAGRVSTQLGKAGYRMGRPTNAANQSTSSTLVEYMQPAYKTDALHVATALKLRASSVRLIDPSTKAVACQSSTPCTTAVVVTVGSDLASQ